MVGAPVVDVGAAVNAGAIDVLYGSGGGLSGHRGPVPAPGPVTVGERAYLPLSGGCPSWTRHGGHRESSATGGIRADGGAGLAGQCKEVIRSKMNRADQSRSSSGVLAACSASRSRSSSSVAPDSRSRSAMSCRRRAAVR
jgi:hypothetical protein